ncbi:retrotransposon protein [Cucumis melo var. makuwa]|uniref:Retrotransposon protein n=1 Tax=Cucumis melo var. makuwa TaxID=1194695 RepID=A0A5D3CYP0_CUCMM|nr:retrotransposon protein [Cucumis melo var. makuwa]TYK15289.1 retrotransposon protein [Cucumis melo var. makuwa]
MELVSMGGWKSDNGTFQPGYLASCEADIPGHRRNVGPVYSGFGWNDEEKCIIAEKGLYDNWVRSHPVAKGLLNKLFLYYNELTYVFGRNRATGRFAETFTDVGSNEPGGYDGFDMGDGNEEIPPVYNQGIDLTQDDVRAS